MEKKPKQQRAPRSGTIEWAIKKRPKHYAEGGEGHIWLYAAIRQDIPGWSIVFIGVNRRFAAHDVMVMGMSEKESQWSHGADDDLPWGGPELIEFVKSREFIERRLTKGVQNKYAIPIKVTDPQKDEIDRLNKQIRLVREIVAETAKP